MACRRGLHGRPARRQAPSASCLNSFCICNSYAKAPFSRPGAKSIRQYKHPQSSNLQPPPWSPRASRSSRSQFTATLPERAGDLKSSSGSVPLQSSRVACCSQGFCLKNGGRTRQHLLQGFCRNRRHCQGQHRARPGPAEPTAAFEPVRTIATSTATSDTLRAVPEAMRDSRPARSPARLHCQHQSEPFIESGHLISAIAAAI